MKWRGRKLRPRQLRSKPEKFVTTASNKPATRKTIAFRLHPTRRNQPSSSGKSCFSCHPVIGWMGKQRAKSTAEINSFRSICSDQSDDPVKTQRREASSGQTSAVSPFATRQTKSPPGKERVALLNLGPWHRPMKTSDGKNRAVAYSRCRLLRRTWSNRPRRGLNRWTKRQHPNLHDCGTSIPGWIDKSSGSRHRP